MVKKLWIGAALMLALAPFSCKQKDSKATDTAAQANERPTDEQIAATNAELKKVFDQWWNAHKAKDASALRPILAEDVMIYGQAFSLDEAITHKDQYFKQNPEFTQELQGELQIEQRTPTDMRIGFHRFVTTKEKAEPVPSFLLLSKIDGEWKITAEQDVMREHLRMNDVVRPADPKEITNCDQAAEAVFKSAPQVQGLLRAPMHKYVLEKRPNDPGNVVHRYTFAIAVTQPHNGRDNVVMRFEVDPVSGQFFQLTPDGSNANPMPSDEQYKALVKKYCEGVAPAPAMPPAGGQIR